jgi:hypothetical protein
MPTLHRYSSWWTQIQQLLDTVMGIMTAGGHRYSSWRTQIQQVVDTVMAVMAAGGHRCSSRHIHVQQLEDTGTGRWWTQLWQLVETGTAAGVEDTSTAAHGHRYSSC